MSAGGCAAGARCAGSVLIACCDLFYAAAGAELDSSLLHGHKRVAATGINDEFVSLIAGLGDLTVVRCNLRRDVRRRRYSHATSIQHAHRYVRITKAQLHRCFRQDFDPTQLAKTHHRTRTSGGRNCAIGKDCCS